MAFMGFWGTGVEPGTQYTEKVSCTVWKMMMMMSDHSSLDYVLLDSITSFLSHEIHIFKMAMPIEILYCDYKRVFRDCTNSIEIIRKTHKLS